MAACRIRKVKSKEELEEMVDDFITQGYKVVSEGESTTRLKKKEWGTASMHIIIFIIFGCLSLGIANLVYALIAHSNAEEVLVKVVGKNKEEDDE